MTLVSAIIVGLSAGYFVGTRRKAFLIMTGVFFLVLAFQIVCYAVPARGGA